MLWRCCNSSLCTYCRRTIDTRTFQTDFCVDCMKGVLLPCVSLLPLFLNFFCGALPNFEFAAQNFCSFSPQFGLRYDFDNCVVNSPTFGCLEIFYFLAETKENRSCTQGIRTTLEWVTPEIRSAN